MKRTAMVTALCAILLFVPSCSSPTPEQITAVISAGTPVAIQKMFSAIAKKNPGGTRAAASALSAFTKADIIPWLKGAPLPATDVVTTLEQKLLSKLNDPAYETAIAVVVGTFSAHLDLQSPKMSTDEQAYAIAFATGVAQGCDVYLAGKVAHLDGKAAMPTANEMIVQSFVPKYTGGKRYVADPGFPSEFYESRICRTEPGRPSVGTNTPVLCPGTDVRR